MRVRTHAAILGILPLVGFLSIVPVFLTSVAFLKNIVYAILILFAWGISQIIVTTLFALLVPLKCSNPNCHGEIQRKFFIDSEYELELWYKCTGCHTLTFSSLSIGGSGGMPNW